VFERWIAGVIGILAIGAGLLFATLPFSLEVGSGENAVTVHGRPPIVSAWSSVRRGPLLLWAVTNGVTGREGFELRSGGRPYAAREARRRLVGAAALIGGGTLAVVFARRRRRPSGATPLPPPFSAQRVKSPAMKGPADD
jgi:hypothetical protein